MRLHLVDHNCNIAIVWVNGKQNQPLSCKFQVNEGRDHVNTCDKAVKFYDIVVINIFFNAIICKIEKKKNVAGWRLQWWDVLFPTSTLLL